MVTGEEGEELLNVEEDVVKLKGYLFRASGRDVVGVGIPVLPV
jgi:hypothetical protein